MTATEEEISRKAYELWDTRGRRDGMDQDDWMSAERLLAGKEPVKLHGRVDVATPLRVAGWVRNGDEPDLPVTVAITVDGQTVAQMEASIFRLDLHAAGIGNGKFSFEFKFDAGFWPKGKHAIDVVCPAFGVPMPGDRKLIDELEAAIAGV